MADKKILSKTLGQYIYVCHDSIMRPSAVVHSLSLFHV